MRAEDADRAVAAVFLESDDTGVDMRELPVIATYDAVHPTNPAGLPGVELDLPHSPLKVPAHRDLLRRFVPGEHMRPVHMRIGTMGACNMRCTFCNFHSPHEKQFYDLFSYKDFVATEDGVEL